MTRVSNSYYCYALKDLQTDVDEQILSFSFTFLNLDIQKRFKMKYAPKSRVMHLENIANREDNNPDAQAEYLKVCTCFSIGCYS